MAQENGVLKGLESMFPEQMAKFGVTGLGMTIIQDGIEEQLGGYGVRSLTSKAPVNTRSIFPIGSVSKTFVAAALGALVDRKAISWDEPIRAYIPDFEMFDPEATQKATPRDLVSMTTGLSGHDIISDRTDISDAEVVRRLKHLEPFGPFRGQWRYCSLTYYVATEIIRRIAGAPWGEFLDSEILRPIGMTDTVFSHAEGRERGDFVTGYHYRDGKLSRAVSPASELRRKSPGASICSSIRDMNLWLRLFLHGGSLNGVRVLSPKTCAEMTSPTTPTRYPDRLEDFCPELYGCWGVRNYRGFKMVFHQGSQTGYRAFAAFVPERKVGVAILSNEHRNYLPYALCYLALDWALGHPDFPWHGYFKWYVDNLPKPPKAKKRLPKRVTMGKARAARYVGDYFHPGYGALSIFRDGSGLGIRYTGYAGSIKETPQGSWATWLTGWHTAGQTMSVRFELNGKGPAAKLFCPMDHPRGQEVEFTRSVVSAWPQGKTETKRKVAKTQRREEEEGSA